MKYKGYPKNEFAINQSGLAPIARRPCSCRYGTEAAEQNEKTVGDYIGGRSADSTNRNYEGHSRKWDVFRRAKNLTP